MENRKAQRLVLSLLLQFLLFGGSASLEAQHPGYAFTSIIDNSHPLFTSFSRPQINAGGTVLVTAYLGNKSALITIADREVTFIADSRGEEFYGFGYADLNDLGLVAFMGLMEGGGDGIFTSDHGEITTVVDVRDPRFGSLPPSSTFYAPTLNNEGAIAFRGALEAGGHGIYVHHGNELKTIAESNNLSLKQFSSAFINNAGQVAYQEYSGSSSLIVSDGTTSRVLADEAGPLRFIGNTIMNDAGAVVFGASYDTGGEGIFVADPSGLRTVMNTHGAFSGPGNYAINLDGEVVFRSGLDSGGFGLFVGSDAMADRLVGNGDPLFGATVTALNITDESLTNSGQVVFSYSLANGVQGIAIATPIIPEPSVGLGVIAGLGLFAARFRGRN